MKNLKFLKSIIILVAVGLLFFLIFINISWFDKYSVFLKEIRVSVFYNINVFNSFFTKINTVNNLAETVTFLKNENTRLTVLLASQEELKNQNEFLRKLMNLEIISNRKFTDARIFNFQFTPEGHYFLVNKGQKSGIKEGDIVVSPDGILVGTINKTNNDFSQAILTTNLGFKVTIKVLGKNTTGIARGALDDGLRLDFISQNDEIKEGDIIVSNGSDLFPPGLLVGNVQKIASNDDGDLFKKIVLEPEFKKNNIDRVLILLQ